jgi:uncharacterized repeat protein (TIGR01451 family)/LPXTG-motif cell wall-anchored protein
MKNLYAAIKRAPKRAAAIAMVTAAIVVPAALFAWGPDRPTFTFASPASYVTFNSITDNPTHGDERNFVQIKDAAASNTTYGEEVTLQPGHEYEVYAYYHNNAATYLNDAEHNYKGIAKDAFMRIQMPAGVKAGEKARVTAFVGASNSNPAQVWDEAYGIAGGDYALRYVPNSAVIHSNGAVNGKNLPDNLFTTGTPLGYDSLNGKLPGCNEFAGYVTYRFTVDQPNFTIEKQVGHEGKNDWTEQITAKPGETIEYKIQYKNTSTTKQDNVIVKDTLPAGVSYVPGSLQMATSVTNGQWKSTGDGVTTTGTNIGSYVAGGNAYMKFKAKIAENKDLAKCGENTLVNKAVAQTGNGTKEDTASVVVTKTCDAPKNIEVCELSTHKIVTIDENKFDSKLYSKNVKDCTNPVTPETPTELPKTGAADSILSLFGLGSVVAAAGYYVASRRGLN